MRRRHARALPIVAILAFLFASLAAGTGAFNLTPAGEGSSVTVAAQQPAATGASAAPALAAPPSPPQPAFAPDRLIVKLRPTTTPASGPLQAQAAGDLFARHGALAADRLFPGQRPLSSLSLPPQAAGAAGLARLYRLRLAPGSDVPQAAARLASDPAVEYAEPDFLAQRSAAPDDPRLAEQWALASLQAPQAWAVVTGTPAVAIAILDSGLDRQHPDLLPNLWTNPGEVAGNGLDDDGNGFVDDTQGWNFVFGNNDPSDDNGHGTLVAGIAAARTGNGTGIAGLCGNCRLLPVKVMQPSGAANYSDIATGIVYAAAKGARVINLSLGGYADSKALQEAIAYALSLNAVLVGGVGNDNTAAPFYPAAYEGVIAVAGTTISDTRTTFTNYGAWVDVAAPGEDVLTTALGGDYVRTAGTSLAAPFASGLAGLLLSLHPDWTPALVRSQLRQTADPIDTLNPGYEGKLGRGRLNAARAVQPPRPILSVAGFTANGVANGRPDFGASATLGVSLYNDWADALNVTGTLATADPFATVVAATAGFGSVLAGQTVANSIPFSLSIAAAAGYNHPIPLTLSLTANDGAYATTLAFTLTTRSSVEPVAGTITTHTLWTADKTYLVGADLGIAPGVTLTIQPGTVVKFDGNFALNVGGTLIAEGTAAQPIIFMGNGSNAWNHLYFDDPSADALVDGDGTYRGGSILRYVQVQGATGGLACAGATPYLANLKVSGGGINCTLGTGTFWLLDSSITGTVAANGPGRVWRSSITNANLSLGGPSEVLTSTVGGSISLGGSSTARAVRASGGLTISGSGTVENSTAGGVSLSSGAVISTAVSGGSMTLGVGSVLSSTVRRGGIVVGGGSTVQGSDVEDAPATGIQTSGTVTVTANRIVGSAGTGLTVSAGRVQGNLIANSGGDGLSVGAATVLSNTFTGNQGRGLYLNGGIPLAMAGNNIERNLGTYDLYNDNAAGPGSLVMAQRNWWGTSDATSIGARIYDFNDNYSKGQVSYTPVLTGPAVDAPAYVRGVTLSPASPVGIQTVAFEVEFSRPMEQGSSPVLSFHNSVKGTSRFYDTSNSGLPSDRVWSITIDRDDKWFAFLGGVGASLLNGTTWTVYGPYNSPLGCDVFASAIDRDGSKWFATDCGVAHLDGTSWTAYKRANSGLPNDHVMAVAVDKSGTKWFSVGGVVSFDGATWTTYNSSNSLLPGNDVWAIAVDQDDSKWFATSAGVARFDGATWTVYNSSNSSLPDDYVKAIAVAPDGTKWFGTGGGAARFDGSGWTVYNTANSGMYGNTVRSIAIDRAGSKWFGLFNYDTASGGSNSVQISELRPDGSWLTYNFPKPRSPVGYLINAIAVDTADNKWFVIPGGGFPGSGFGVIRGGPDYTITSNSQWQFSTRYRAAFDFNTLVPRDNYTIRVAGPRGTDGIEIAPYSGVTFTVDYAGYIADTTPPGPPTVVAWSDGSATSIAARWLAADAQSAITAYRYAIGTTPGGSDVVNWTNVGSTEVTRSGLNLLRGQTYYVSVKARNEGGLWSEPGASNGVTGGMASTPVPFPTSTPTVTGTPGPSATPTVTGTPGAATTATATAGPGATGTPTGSTWKIYLPAVSRLRDQ